MGHQANAGSLLRGLLDNVFLSWLRGEACDWKLDGAGRGSMSKGPGDHTIHSTFPFTTQQIETPILFGIQEILLLPDASLGMLLLPALPCGTQNPMYYGE